MRYNLIILLLAIALPITGNGQWKYDETKISNRTKKIVSQFKELYHLTLDSSSRGKKDNIQDYNNFLELKKVATKDELTELVNHPSPIIRCYSFWALSQRDSSDLLPIIQAHSDDTTLYVNAYMGSFYAAFYVKEFFHTVILNANYHKGAVQLTQEQKHLIDSLDK